jgi:hypothetical protein
MQMRKAKQTKTLTQMKKLTMTTSERLNMKVIQTLTMTLTKRARPTQMPTLMRTLALKTK